MSMSVYVKTGYAPLEQYDTHGNQGQWTDVFAFACTIYRSITGTLPANALTRSKSSAELKSPIELGADINRNQEQVLLKGMEIDYQKRYQDIDSFYQALLAARSDSQPQPKQKKNILPLAAFIAFAVSALYTAGYFLYLFINAMVFKELFAQQIVLLAALGFISVMLIPAIKGKKCKINLIKFISLGVFILSALSAIIFSIAVGGHYSGYLTDIGTMIIYMHVPILAALTALLFVLSKSINKSSDNRG
jgi:serine/threonine protein kinase